MARALLKGVITASGVVLGTAGAYSAIVRPTNLPSFVLATTVWCKAYSAVLSAERVGARHERQLEAESSAQTSLAESLRQSEHAARELSDLLTRQHEAILETEKDLHSTRQRLHRLEEERREQDVQVADMEAQVAERRRCAAQMHTQLQLRAETMAMLERAAAEARVRAAAARSEVNPLNHPIVQEYFSKR